MHDWNLDKKTETQPRIGVEDQPMSLIIMIVVECDDRMVPAIRLCHLDGLGLAASNFHKQAKKPLHLDQTRRAHRTFRTPCTPAKELTTTRNPWCGWRIVYGIPSSMYSIYSGRSLNIQYIYIYIHWKLGEARRWRTLLMCKKYIQRQIWLK